MVILHRGSTSTTIVTATVGSRSTQRSFECQFRWNGQPPDEPRSSSCASRYSTFCSRIGMSPVRIVAYLMPPPYLRVSSCYRPPHDNNRIGCCLRRTRNGEKVTLDF
jgi:hypothetical protein